MARTPFFGSAYVSRSSNVADDQLINLYPEIVSTKQGKEIGSFYTTPGLDYLFTLGAGPIRALYATSPNASFANRVGNVLYAISGVQFYSLFSRPDPFLIATIDNLPGAWSFELASGNFSRITLPFNPIQTFVNQVSIVTNGVQVGIFQGMTVDQMDGYVFINEPQTYRWWQSNLLDLTTWDPLNFASASGNPDAIISVSQIHREVFIGKEQHTEVWINAGTAGFVFQRVDGVYIEVGVMHPATVVTVGETLMWVGKNTQGEFVVVQCVGYNPIRVSTHYIERKLAEQWGQPQGLSAYSYMQEGHSFYALNIGDLTLVYDVTASREAGVPMWHERDTIDADGNSHRHWADNAAVFNDQIIVGDYRNGNIYSLNLNTAMDNTADQGFPRRWLRSWRAMPKPSDDPMRFDALRLDLETGSTSTLPMVTPYARLRWSDDGGHRWSNGRLHAAGKIGETARRVTFKRLGSTRRNTGLDRIFEVSSSDLFPGAIIAADLQ